MVLECRGKFQVVSINLGVVNIEIEIGDVEIDWVMKEKRKWNNKEEYLGVFGV